MYCKSNFINHVCFVTLLLLLAGCAQIVAPTGGAKDKMPPVAESFSPENQSTEYQSGDPLEIEFDEYVKLNLPMKNVSISPPTEEKLDFKLKGKKVITTLNGTLKENTTYTINFGEAIKDITEGNKLPDLEYVISTGSIIDSGQIAGKLVDAFSGEAVPGAYVCAYDTYADSIPYQELPSYLDITNDTGFFLIPHMKLGRYRLFALKDGNNNLLFDLTSEEIGYIKEPIDNTDSVKYLISLFKEDKEIQYVKETKQLGSKITVVFNRPTKDLRVAGEQVVVDYQNENKDSLSLWIDPKAINPVIIYLSDVDFQDTLSVEMEKEEEAKLNVVSNIPKGKKMDYFNIFRFSFSELVYHYDPTKMIMTENRDTVEFGFHSSDTVPFENLSIDYNWKDSARYRINLLPNAFSTNDSLTNDTSLVNFSTRERGYYNQVTLSITGGAQDQSYIMQLFNDKKKMLKEFLVKGNNKITYEYLGAGKYQLKLIYDDNQNGKWDTGDYMKDLQPEKVLTYEEGFEVKAGWESDIIWDLE